ncbi:MAG TPA: hypothetical protein VFO86_07200, partial [Terriglobia bacterium]|nr:hypothetical protein [Terriglobia bacterium]
MLPSLSFAINQDTQRLEGLKQELRAAPTVDYCELNRHKENYDGKIVRVRGVYWTDFEESTLASPFCDAPFMSSILRTWIEHAPEFDKLTDRKWRRKLHSTKWRTGLDVVFVGRFESTRHDRIHGFGHLDGYSARIVVMSAELAQSLGKFSSLPTNDQTSNPKPQFTLCNALKDDPDEAVRVSATLTVVKESSTLSEPNCPDERRTFADFSTYWLASTRPDVARAIDQKRGKSGGHESLDVIVEGFLLPN